MRLHDLLLLGLSIAAVGGLIICLLGAILRFAELQLLGIALILFAIFVVLFIILAREEGVQ